MGGRTLSALPSLNAALPTSLRLVASAKHAEGSGLASLAVMLAAGPVTPARPAATAACSSR